MGLPIRYWAAIIGACGLILIIVALGVDKLWRGDEGVMHWKIGWKSGQNCPHSSSTCQPKEDTDGDLKKRGIVWLVFGILSVVAGTAGVMCIIVDKYTSFMSDRVKRITRPIRFAMSGIFIFIASIVVASYDDKIGGSAGVSLKPAASPIIGFIATVVMIIPACILWFVK